MSAPEAAPSLALPATIVIRRLAVLGAGAEGTWLARRAALAGYQVTLEDLMPSRRREAAQQLGDDSPPIGYASTVEEAAREADLVIDFVPDELESKLEILSLLDRMAPPHTIFATPTRVLSIADLASCTYRAERCLALRLPEPLRGGPGGLLIEIVHAPQASAAAIRALREFWVALGAKVSVSIDHATLP